MRKERGVVAFLEMKKPLIGKNRFFPFSPFSFQKKKGGTKKRKILSFLSKDQKLIKSKWSRKKKIIRTGKPPAFSSKKIRANWKKNCPGAQHTNSNEGPF